MSQGLFNYLDTASTTLYFHWSVAIFEILIGIYVANKADRNPGLIMLIAVFAALSEVARGYGFILADKALTYAAILALWIWAAPSFNYVFRHLKARIYIMHLTRKSKIS